MSRRMPRASSSRKPRFEILEDRRMLAVLTVNSDADFEFNNDNGSLTLREAIAVVNRDYVPDPNISGDFAQINDLDGTEPVGTNDKIVFSTVPADGLNGGTILLDKGDINTAGQELLITKSVTIDATMLTDGLTIKAHDLTPNQNNGDGTSVFIINTSGSQATSREFTLAGLTITGGDANYKGGGVAFNAHAEAGNSTLTIRDSTIIDNHTLLSGGGIAFEGTKVTSSISVPLTLNVIRSTIQDNSAVGTQLSGADSRDKGGGGIFVDARGNATDSEEIVFNLTDSEVSGNTTEHEGGGVWFCVAWGGTFNATQSTISGNQADVRGGGLWIANNPLSDDFEYDTMLANLDHMTITENDSPDGGGLHSGNLSGAAHPKIITTLNHTILSGNHDLSNNDNNLAGGIEDVSSYNLLGPVGVSAASLNANGGTGNISNTSNDPGLLPLADNGGTTKTHLPKAISLALDAGNPLFTPSYLPVLGSEDLTYDQRGEPFDRVVDYVNGGSQIDIGAVELQFLRVTDVIIASSTGFHDDYAFDSIIDEERLEPNPVTGIQLDTVPVGGADMVKIKFNKPIDVATAENALTLFGSQNLNRPMPTDFFYDTATKTGKWTFTGWTFGDRYSIRLDDVITDLEGSALDGEWINPLDETVTNLAVSTFPSGDRMAGGEFVFVATLLPGDANLDSVVDLLDLDILGTHYGMHNMSLDAVFADADFNGDSVVDLLDLDLLGMNFGTNLQGDYLLLADLAPGNGTAVDSLDGLAWAAFEHDYRINGIYNADADFNEDGFIDMDDEAFLLGWLGFEGVGSI